MRSFELNPPGILKFDLFKILTRFNYLISTIFMLENQNILSITYDILIHKKKLINLSFHLESKNIIFSKKIYTFCT